MLTLALDTSAVSLSLALANNGTVLAKRRFEDRRGQSEVIIPLIDSALREADRHLNELGQIAVVTGPGSFTGLRLGLAAAAGLARALDCPVIGFDRFTLIRNFASTDKLAIVLESLRAELFVELMPGQPEMLTPDDIAVRLKGEAWTLAGDATSKIAGDFPCLDLPEGADLVVAALAAGCSPSPAQPFYLRAPDVTLTRP